MIDRAYLERLADKIQSVEHDISNPQLAGNPRKYRDVVREHTRLRRIFEQAESLERIERELAESRQLVLAEGLDPEMRALAKAEILELEAQLPVVEHDLHLAMVPPDPNDERNVIMEIRAGTGGEEAALFAGDLFRMYSRYIERQGWKLGLIDASSSSAGGFKDIVFTVEGADVYRGLKYESGCHRVQRVPVTESSGRIHTSAATVAVLPQADEVDDLKIPPDEVRIDIFCSSGPGGQSVNTTYSAIRVTHLPTGIVAQSQDERSQARNKEKAMAVLKARLLDVRRQADEERSGQTRRSQIGTGDRSEKIRTYNFPQNRLTDHRINFTLYSLNRVMEGELDEVIRALYENDIGEQVKQIMTSG
jgi:peptide chain release factor 1